MREGLFFNMKSVSALFLYCLMALPCGAGEMVFAVSTGSAMPMTEFRNVFTNNMIIASRDGTSPLPRLSALAGQRVGTMRLSLPGSRNCIGRTISATKR